MIELETWASQIFAYCDLISDGGVLKRTWVHRESGLTSVTDFDELYEQIFDDLDSDSFTPDLRRHFPGKPELCDALANFLSSIKDIDAQRMRETSLLNAQILLASPEWQKLRESARQVLREVGKP